MPSTFQHGGRCVYCAFRAHQLALQSLRHRQCNVKRLFHSTPPSSARIRYSEPSHNVRFGKPPRDASLEIRGSGGIIHKHVTGHENEHRKRRRGVVQFESQLEFRLNAVKEGMRKAPLVEELRKEKIKDGQKPPSFDELWKDFADYLTRKANRESIPFLGRVNDDEHEKTITALQTALDRRGVFGLDDRLRYAFYTRLISPRFTSSDTSNQRALADLRYPSEWYPATRVSPRTVHLHVGPTNSGKTYHALQRLEQADSGVYAGPLRLLAHEVYTRMNAKGKPCSLITGEERRLADPEAQEYGTMASCTVEMMPLNRRMDVAVIDEIQMIGNAERGWAWTQAFLGIQAKEVHLCGEERTVPLVQEICASLGEKLHIHRYERLTPLEMEDRSLNGKLKDLRKGDCVVSFSVMGIHALRQQIERQTGKKVATVYGSLPPETRAQQARLFNDPDNDYDFLVASDAVGMGLNLAIKRIVFEASNKYDGSQRRTLNVADIKQIAGRAGRYKIATFKSTDEEGLAKEDLAAAKGEPLPPRDHESNAAEASESKPVSNDKTEEVTTGLITTLENFDYPIVRAAMSARPEPIRSAGLFPPGPILERFASYFPPFTPFSYILTRLHELSQMHPRFHLCGLKDQLWIADLIESVNSLTVTDRNIICSCPASMTDKELWVKLMPAFAKCIAEQTGGAIFDIEELPLEVLEADVSASRQYLRELERLHKGVVAYLWLSYRFAGVFNTRGVAFHVKSLVEAKIEEVLSKFSFTESQRQRLAKKREKALLLGMEADAEASEGEEAEGAEEEESALAQTIDESTGQLELHDQTSMTSGGDHFGGEGDFGFEEPDENDHSEKHVSPIQSLDGSQETESAEPFSSMAAEADNQDRPAFAKDEAGNASDRHFKLEDVMPEAAESPLTSEENKASSPEQDATQLEPSFVPKTKLGNDGPPVETQQASPVPEEPRVPGEAFETSAQESESGRTPAGFNKFGAGVPPKHLAHLDVDAKQAEQDWASRP